MPAPPRSTQVALSNRLHSRCGGLILAESGVVEPNNPALLAHSIANRHRTVSPWAAAGRLFTVALLCLGGRVHTETVLLRLPSLHRISTKSRLPQTRGTPNLIEKCSSAGKFIRMKILPRLWREDRNSRSKSLFRRIAMCIYLPPQPPPAAMTDDTLLPFDLPSVCRKKITVDFNGGTRSSNGGLLLLREKERTLGVCWRLANTMTDRRDPNRIRHEMFEMVMARVSAIACGYEDANDLDRLRHDQSDEACCWALSTERRSAGLAIDHLPP